MSRELTRNAPGNKEKRIKVAKLCKAFSFRLIRGVENCYKQLSDSRDVSRIVPFFRVLNVLGY